MILIITLDVLDWSETWHAPHIQITRAGPLRVHCRFISHKVASSSKTIFYFLVGSTRDNFSNPARKRPHLIMMVIGADTCRMAIRSTPQMMNKFFFGPTINTPWLVGVWVMKPGEKAWSHLVVDSPTKTSTLGKAHNPLHHPHTKIMHECPP